MRGERLEVRDERLKTSSSATLLSNLYISNLYSLLSTLNSQLSTLNSQLSTLNSLPSSPNPRHLALELLVQRFQVAEEAFELLDPLVRGIFH